MYIWYIELLSNIAALQKGQKGYGPMAVFGLVDLTQAITKAMICTRYKKSQESVTVDETFATPISCAHVKEEERKFHNFISFTYQVDFAKDLDVNVN